MTGYEWAIVLLAFSVLINACYIGLRIWDHYADRRTQREIDKLRHPSNRHRDPVRLEDWRRHQRDAL